MRGIYKAGNGKYKIGVNGSAIYKTYADAKRAFLSDKLLKLQKAMQNVLSRRNK